MCTQVCVKKCIEIKENNLGFLYPEIDEEICVQCGICKDKCPVNNFVHNKYKIRETYKCSSKNYGNIINSTSGGIVFELSHYIVDELNGIFAGAEMKNDLSVHHTLTDSIEQLTKYQGSKYIQSYVDDSYEQVRMFLEEGRIVLFVGTPCQVNALILYLKKEYSNLYTVDFICHGVGSSRVFKMMVEDIIKSKSLDSISKINFRNKEHGYLNGRLQIQLQNNKNFFEDFYCSNAFGYGFANDLITRESCVQCKYIGILRNSDITVADYTGDDMDDYQRENGCSFVFINSDKGKKLFSSCSGQFDYEEKILTMQLKNCII